jgi:hypothetical protein
MLRPSNNTASPSVVFIAAKIGAAELLPLGDHDQGVGALQRIGR